eukprot:TRINITY_DN93625_c0_g1_i1.p1 TRINITY_DN93625_c0_g1~~TRINITY_DN93625_c0_g1_i1.p1  ORF type:complete len:515 (+),score=104.41 TRINITY_DN93625_c0_g1_i1:36-1580(+)
MAAIAASMTAMPAQRLAPRQCATLVASPTLCRPAVVRPGAVAVAAAAATALCRRCVQKPTRLLHRRRNGSAKTAVLRRAAEVEVQADFVSACSMNPDWEKAIEEVADVAGTGFEAGFVFVSEMHVDGAQGMAPLLEKMRERLGVQHLVGGAVGGAIGQAAGQSALEFGGGGAGGDWPPIEVERGWVMSVGLMRNAGAVPFFIGKDASGDVELVNRMANEGNVRSLLLLGDPFGPVEDIMRSIDETFPKAVKAGGVTAALQVGKADRQAFMPSMAISSEGTKARLCSEGICGLMLTEMEVHTVVCQGCLGVGPAVRISQMAGPVCTGIGGRPAKEALMLIFGAVDEETRKKMQEGLTIGLGRPGEPETSVADGDWQIRGISQVTPNGGLVVGHGIEEGQPLRFHVRDKNSAEGDLDLMLNRYRLERMFHAGGEPAGCLLFTCNGRGEALYGRRHVDSRALPKALGDAVGTRISGFFCNGEIGAPGLAMPEGDDNVRSAALHGFTAVFAMLVPKKR